MSISHMKRTVSALLATLMASAAIGTSPLAAQPAQGSGPQSRESVPPSGQYAPPPPGYENGNATYDEQSQQADRAYAQQYSEWAARYCVDQHNNNTVAGALIGGVLGAGLGAAIAHNPATGAAIGGALGVGVGAAAGASQPAYGCPPGYVVAAGAPAFAYVGPYWGPSVYWAPAWYHPWVWVDGRWVFHPYRYWYWWHRAYWHPGWRSHPWHYRYYRW